MPQDSNDRSWFSPSSSSSFCLFSSAEIGQHQVALTYFVSPICKKGVAVAAKVGGKLLQSINNNRQKPTITKK